MSEGPNLQHEFIPCTLRGCTDTTEHCHHEWCGAPKRHSIHIPPAEPVIEVAPGEYERCAVLTVDGQPARLVESTLHGDGSIGDLGVPVPAVPAQEAPREQCFPSAVEALEAMIRLADLGQTPDPITLNIYRRVIRREKQIETEAPAEPQADAQVPSRDGEYELFLNTAARSELVTAIQHIVAYATEAAKTPITREDMHDPLKAQTFFDEAQGFYRLVLSEIGGSK